LYLLGDAGETLAECLKEIENPHFQKKAGTLEHYRTINKILITFLDKVQWNQ